MNLAAENIHNVKLGTIHATDGKQQVTCMVYDNYPAETGDGYAAEVYLATEEVEDAINPLVCREWNDSIEDLIVRELNSRRA